MNVNFYTFSKRINSTAQPTGGASFSCVLKSPSSVTAPKISLVWTGAGNPSAYNYAYIADYRRYYWVSNWTYADRQWTADLGVDVLASYKAAIGSANKYILRSASSENTDAMEASYPALATYKSDVKVGNFSNWANYGSDNAGYYVLTVVGDNDAGTSGIAQYQVKPSEVQKIVKAAINAIDGAAASLTTATDIIEGVKQLLLLPIRFTADLSQYIRGIMWFPCSFTEDPSATPALIKLGLYPVTSSTYKPLRHPIQVDSQDISLADLPATGKKKWEYLPPFSNYTLFAQPWGAITIDALDIVENDVLRLIYRIDALSGLGILDVYVLKTGGTPRLVASRTAQVGVAVPYGGVSPNYAGAIKGGVEVAATATAYAAGEVGGLALAAAIGNAAVAAAPTGYSSGVSGGAAAIYAQQYLFYRILDHVDTDPTEIGYPLCEMATISSLSGYVQCRDGDINCPGTAAELAQIASYLTGGFFYE